MTPQIRPHTIPTIAAIGIDSADWPRETPPTKTIASMPSRKMVTKGSKKSAHFPVRPSPRAPYKQIGIQEGSERKEVRTLSFECLLELETPLSLGSVQLEHTDAHNEDQDGGDKRECAYDPHSSNIVKPSLPEALPSQISSDFAQRLEAFVNQMAINVAPMAAAMRKPSAEPAKIWKAVSTT